MSSGTNTAYYGPTLASGEVAGDGVSYHLSQVRSQDITDGLSNTIFASEKYMEKCPKYNYFNGTAAADNNSAMDGFGCQQNRWVPYPGNATYLAGTSPMKDGLYYTLHNNQPDNPDGANIGSCWRFGSCHTEGMNTVFCDGSATTINFSIDPNAFGCLGVRNDQSHYKYPESELQRN